MYGKVSIKCGHVEVIEVVQSTQTMPIYLCVSVFYLINIPLLEYLLHRVLHIRRPSRRTEIVMLWLCHVTHGFLNKNCSHLFINGDLLKAD